MDIEGGEGSPGPEARVLAFDSKGQPGPSLRRGVRSAPMRAEFGQAPARQRETQLRRQVAGDRLNANDQPSGGKPGGVRVVGGHRDHGGAARRSAYDHGRPRGLASPWRVWRIDWRVMLMNGTTRWRKLARRQREVAQERHEVGLPARLGAVAQRCCGPAPDHAPARDAQRAHPLDSSAGAITQRVMTATPIPALTISSQAMLPAALPSYARNSGPRRLCHVMDSGGCYGKEDRPRFRPGIADPVRRLRARGPRSARLSRQGRKVRGRRRHGRHAARSAEPEVLRSPGRQADDGRINAEHVEYASPNGNGKMRGYLVQPTKAAGQAAGGPGDPREPRIQSRTSRTSRAASRSTTSSRSPRTRSSRWADTRATKTRRARCSSSSIRRRRARTS